MADVTGALPPTGPHDDPSSTPQDTGVAGSVTNQWTEVYPPDGVDPDDDPIGAEPGRSWAELGVSGLFAVAVVLVVVGSITPLLRVALPLGPANLTSVLSMNAWRLSSGAQVPGGGGLLPSQTVASPIPIGYPLVVAAVLLALVMLLRLWPSRRSVAGAADRMPRVFGAVAATFLAGLVFTLGMFEAAWRGLGTSQLLGPLDTSIGTGYWVLVVAALVAILAAVLSFRRPPVEFDDEPLDVLALDSSTEDDRSPVPPGQPAEWPVVAVIPDDDRTRW